MFSNRGNLLETEVMPAIGLRLSSLSRWISVSRLSRSTSPFPRSSSGAALTKLLLPSYAFRPMSDVRLERESTISLKFNVDLSMTGEAEDLLDVLLSRCSFGGPSVIVDAGIVRGGQCLLYVVRGCPPQGISYLYCTIIKTHSGRCTHVRAIK